MLMAWGFPRLGWWIIDRLLGMLLIDPRKGEIFTMTVSVIILLLLVTHGDNGNNFVMFVHLIAPHAALVPTFLLLMSIQSFGVFSNSTRVRQWVAVVDCTFWVFSFISIAQDSAVGVPHAVTLAMALSAAFTCVQLRLRETGHCA